MDAKSLLFAGLAFGMAVWIVTMVRGGWNAPSPFQLIVGFITAGLDTLGIGSFATTTAVFKLRSVVPVKLMPGTLNAGHTLATITQAFIYTQLVPVDTTTLVLMIVAACLGAWLGAGFVVHWSRRKIQIGMGLALTGAATILLLQQLNFVPGGGDTLSLTGVRLVVGLAGNFALGVLMMLGIGLYGPCMILVSLLGMNPTAAFPIMMGSCAFLMPTSVVRFVRSGTYHKQAAWGLALGGVPAVLIAAYIIRSLPLGAVRWLVVVVVYYTAANMLMTLGQESPDRRDGSEGPVGQAMTGEPSVNA